MADEARKNERHVEVEKNRDVSGIYLVDNKPGNAASLQTSEAPNEIQTTEERYELDAKALIEEPTDELSVLLSEKVDGAVNQEPLFIPKNPLPDPELIALAKSMEACYERNGEAWNDNAVADSHFDFSKLSTTSSLLPPPAKTSSWTKVASVSAAAVVIALAGAVGGWYAALNATRPATANIPSAISPSSDDSTPRAAHSLPQNLDPAPLPPIPQTPEPKASAVYTESVDDSHTTEPTIGVDEIKASQPIIGRMSGSVPVVERFSRASKPELSATAATSPEATQDAIDNAVAQSVPVESSPTNARSDQSEGRIVAATQPGDSVPTQVTKDVETAEMTETSATSESAVPPSLPETLTREQVRDGFKSLYQQIGQCAAGRHGVAQIKATVAGSGRVVFALVDGAFKGSPEGSCMARAVRKATFPEFTKSKLTVEFPYVL